MTNQPDVVFTDDVTITMRGVSDSIGLPYTVNPLELVDREALIELREGPAGLPGPEGEPSWPWLWQGDIADVAALQMLKLTTADARKAWRVVSKNAIYFWTGLEFIAFDKAFGHPGRPGTANSLTGTGVAGPTGSAASAQITGTAPMQGLTITFPRGETGDVGEQGVAGRIQDAADVQIDDAHPLGQDYVLAWNATLGKFVPIPSPRLGGPWAIGRAQFNGGVNIGEQTKTIAALTIPGQPMAWRPLVSGSVIARAPLGKRCDIDITIGSPTGELVGKGFGWSGTNWDQAIFVPHFAVPLSPTSTSTVGVVRANQTVTLYVSVRHVGDAPSYTIDTNGAQLIVYAQPV